MLRYEWNNHSNSPPPNLILSEMDLHHHQQQQQHHHHNHNNHHHHHHDFSSNPSSSNPHRPIFDDPFSTPCTFPHDNCNTNPPQLPFFANSFTTPTPPSSVISLDSFSSVMHTPKMEPDHVFTNRPIGLNLGRRTYFSADDDLVSRLYRRSRAMEPTVHSPRCQAEGCNADLSHAKHYHRRHKVCEFHSKASTVIAAGLTQRFCQQCSRFHLLSEFDNGKRSCRKRLADHNRRRRKSNNQRITPTASASLSSENAQSSPSQNILRSPSDSGINSSSSVTIAVSPPRFDSSFMERSYD